MGFNLSFLNLFFLAGLAIASPLKQKRALATVYSQCTVPKTVALTFDDGPYIYNKQVSDLLTSAGAKGTFFFNGYNYDCIYTADNIARIKYLYAAGHQIGSHTWSHADLATLTVDQITDGFYRVEEALSRIIGIKPAFMRPPFGSYNDDVRTVAASRGQALAIWDQDTEDADGETVQFSEAVYQDAVNQKVSNMLVLNHETIETTPEQVIPFAINLLQKNGYKLVTLSECLGGIAPYQQIGLPQNQTADWTCDGTPLPGDACDGSSIPCKTGQVNVVTGGGGSTGGGGGSTGTNTPQSNIVIHPTTSSTKCLTAASNANNAAVEISDCVASGSAGAANQLWSVTASGISIFGGSMCLDVTSGSAADGNKMQIYSCSSGNANQGWTVSGSSIKWTGHTSCLDNTGGVLTNGNVVQIWSCTNGVNQQWTIGQPSSNGGGGTTTPVTGKAIHPGKSSTTCLTVASNTNNAAVTVAPCVSGSASQAWTQTGGTFKIYGDKCLDVPSGSTANGVKLQVYTCTAGNTNQQFVLTGDNRLAWTNHGECMDLTDGSVASGNKIQLWACGNGNANQVWNFV